MNEYYTLTGLLTQGGAIVGTTLVTASVGKLGGVKVTPYLKFVAAFLALLFAFLFAKLGQSGAPDWWSLALLTLVNGAIVFLSAMGGNEMMASGTGGVVTDMTPEPRPQPEPIVESLVEPVVKRQAKTVASAPVIAAGYRDPDSPAKPDAPQPKFFRSWF